jgi:uncharacterized membrane protein YoaK (UPF0700 family)
MEIIAMKDKIERLIHLNMALIGGFIGGYAILNHSDLFGSAQTSNMITLALELAGKDKHDFLIRLVGLFFYALGLSSTVIIPRILKKSNLKFVSVVIDAIALIISALLPSDTTPFIALYPIFFATAFQWCTFKGMEGYNSATIFSTNNLRQFITAFTEYLCSGDLKMRHKAKLYGTVLLSFHIGVAISYVAGQVWSTHSAWVGLIPLVPAVGLILNETRIVERAEQNEAINMEPAI